MGSSPSFEMTVDVRSGVVRLGLRGELDISSAPHVSEQLIRSEQDGCADIMLDLRELTFIDSTGLHALIQAWERARENGHRLLIVGASPDTRRLVELTGTEYLLDGREAVSTLKQFTRRKADDGLPNVESVNSLSG